MRKFKVMMGPCPLLTSQNSEFYPRDVGTQTSGRIIDFSYPQAGSLPLFSLQRTPDKELPRLYPKTCGGSHYL